MKNVFYLQKTAWSLLKDDKNYDKELIIDILCELAILKFLFCNLANKEAPHPTNKKIPSPRDIGMFLCTSSPLNGLNSLSQPKKFCQPPLTFHSYIY